MHPYITNDNIYVILVVCVCMYVPSASRTHKFVVFFFPKPGFFFSYEKTPVFLRKYVFFFTREKTYFSHTWYHDISWFLPLDDSNPFIDTSLGSIPLSTVHVDYTSTPLALAGSSQKKGPDALGTCRTTLSVFTVNLESLDDFFRRTTPRSINWNMALLFSLRKNDCGLPKSNKQSNESIEQNYQNHEKSIGNFQFLIISDNNFRVCTQKMPKTHI